MAKRFQFFGVMALVGMMFLGFADRIGSPSVAAKGAPAAQVGGVTTQPAVSTPQGLNEAQLQARIAMNQQDLEAFLQLVGLYARQGRFDDAERTLGRAQGALLAQRRTVEARLNPPPPPGEPFRIGGDVPVPKKTKYVDPVMPKIAQSAKIAGNVYLELIVNAQGKVTNAQVLGGPALLRDAALDAAKQWEFEPTIMGGSPVSVIMTVTVVFKSV